MSSLDQLALLATSKLRQPSVRHPLLQLLRRASRHWRQSVQHQACHHLSRNLRCLMRELVRFSIQRLLLHPQIRREYCHRPLHQAQGLPHQRRSRMHLLPVSSQLKVERFVAVHLGQVSLLLLRQARQIMIERWLALPSLLPYSGQEASIEVA